MSSPKISAGLIGKIARKEGIRDPEDAFEFVTGEPSAQTRAAEREMLESFSSFKITVEVDESKITPEKARLIEDVEAFCRRFSVNFREAMIGFLEEYHQNRGQSALTVEMVKKMHQRGYDLPVFFIKDERAAEEFFVEAGLGEGLKLDQNAVVLVFNLPKPLARFWYRGATEFSDSAVAVKEGEVEWGYLYRMIMPAVWREVGQEGCEGELVLDRVNYAGEHDPQSYYYVWVVSRWLSSEQIGFDRGEPV